MRFILLRDDQTIKGLKNEAPRDLARTARITASAQEPTCDPVSVINGWTRAMGKVENRWAAPLGTDGAKVPGWSWRGTRRKPLVRYNSLLIQVFSAN